MKPTKQIKKELATAYRCAIEVGILNMKAPLRYINQYIAENVSGFGTAADEKVRSRAEFRSMVMRGRQQSKGFLFKAKIITPYRPKFTDENTAQFHDEIIVQIGEKKNKHTLHLWFSTIYTYQKTKWQMVMFHGSMPDAGSSTSDTFHVAEAEKKVKKLEDIVEQRTIELQTKNNELEIETALERVRAIALSMQRSEDMLKVCRVISDELTRFGVKEIRNIQTVIIREEKKFYLCYQYFTAYKKAAVELTYYHKNPVEKELVTKMLDAKGGYFEGSIKGKKLQQFREHRKKEKFLPDPRLDKSKEIFYYMYSIGEGALGITLYKDVKENELILFKRFHQVFILAYKRFRDIEKAEAQTRESQIELALERVRARTMAMQKSEELPEAANVLFLQVQSLGIPAWSCGYNILAADKKSSTCIMSSEGEIQVPFVLPLTEHSSLLPWYEAIQNNLDFFVYGQGGEDLKEHYNYLATVPGLEEVFQQFDNAGISLPTNQINHLVRFTNGFLLFITYESVPHAHDIFKRFGKVFEQTYTRFLDLQKAEAQAREALIEAALERVRSRSLAMHSSGELGEVVTVVLNNLLELGYIIDQGAAAHLAIFSEGTKDFFQWSADPALPHPVRSFIPHTDLPILTEFWDARQKGHDFFAKVYSFDEKNTWFNYAFEHSDLKHIPGKLKKLLLESETYAHSVAIEKNSAIIINSITGNQLSENQIDILRRFSKVFEQAYIRFLDLQKAEAQAREAEIELGLERVRARAMAMQSSNELSDLVDTVFKELTKLDFAINMCIINIIDESTLSNMVWGANPDTGKPPDSYYMKFEDYPFHHAMMKGYKERNTKFIYVIEGNEKKIYDEYLFNETEFRKMPKEAQAASKALEKYVCSFTFSNFGGLQTVADEPLSAINLDILERFGKVFDLTYTRFNDLLKAEAQAREARIEAALEKVRSRTMGMQQSHELGDVATVLFKELNQLVENLWTCGFVLCEKDRGEDEWWLSNGDGFIPAFYLPNTGDPTHANIYDAWKKGETYHTEQLEGKALQEHYDWLMNIPVSKNIFDEMKAAGNALPSWQKLHCAYFLYGYLVMITQVPCPEEQIFKRFAQVFDQTYTRFLDLQKAEAQAREAQIQLALERARTQSMIMQHSNELDATLRVFHEQVLLLGINSSFSFLWLPDEKKERHIFWATWAENNSTVFKSKTINYSLDRKEPATAQCLVDWKSNVPVYSYHVPTPAVENYFAVWQELIDGAEHLKPEYFSGGLYYVEAFMKYGCFGVMVTIDLTDGEQKLLSRFALEFERTYTRFLDLQKAEAQAREAQIELGLERVRARAMAMQKSDELSGLVAVLFEELIKLDLILYRCIIWIFNPDTLTARIWMANSEDKENAESYYIKKLDHPYYNAILKGWKERNPKWVYDLHGKDKKSIDELLLHETELSHLPQSVKAGILSSRHTIVSGSFNNFGLIEASGPVSQSEEQLDILNRFGKVFDLTYTRFNDLKQAEAQAREAKIEAALERVRGKAMAMHSSKDLAETILVFYHEIELLSVTPRRCGVGLLNKENHIVEISTMSTTEDGKPIEVIGKINLEGHPVLERIYDNWFHQKEYHPVLRGNEIKEYYKLIRPQISYPDYPNDVAQYGYFFYFPEGGVFTWTDKELLEDELKIYRRFTSVLSLTYKRYKDIQRVEANAREAIKQAALDRIRADIASMRTTKDLERITPLIWNELTILGIPFIRCGVFIMDESQQLIHTFLSTPDGKAIAAFHLPYDTPGNIKHTISHWRNNKNYIDHWDEDEFVRFADILVKQGALVSPEQYLQTIPQGGFYLHFLPFLQGMLYVGNTTQLKEDEIKLIQSVANAFSTAYARYEDFNKLEAAKGQIENTLTNLKQAQAQLVQSEKMASLGELTAGIAHEIQNPLNFVNNFSEVSNELIDEMMEEVEKGNYDEVKAIADDVKQNLEKINHHGKRADGIVKGMLQHSRSSSGVKEPTDINKLADEYLRLAYHGLRAKDKSFNATMKTEFDETIGNINIIPQDIGRVILNLITNAFYAASQPPPSGSRAERREGTKFGGAKHEPTIWVSTKKMANSVLISVRDNGPGIPQSIIDKIFQPFFTTKPTGQGTGLGLSLAYDIVKAHGGELKVETKENEGLPAGQAGTTFTIQLPHKT